MDDIAFYLLIKILSFNKGINKQNLWIKFSSFWIMTFSEKTKSLNTFLGHQIKFYYKNGQITVLHLLFSSASKYTHMNTQSQSLLRTRSNRDFFIFWLRREAELCPLSTIEHQFYPTVKSNLQLSAATEFVLQSLANNNHSKIPRVSINWSKQSSYELRRIQAPGQRLARNGAHA